MPHNVPTNKLHSFVFDDKFLSLRTSGPNGCSQKVSDHGHFWTPFDVLTDMSQGSNPGLLYLLLLNNVVRCIFFNAKAWLFIDRLKFFLETADFYDIPTKLPSWNNSKELMARDCNTNTNTNTKSQYLGPQYQYQYQYYQNFDPQYQYQYLDPSIPIPEGSIPQKWYWIWIFQTPHYKFSKLILRK